jgi:ubiquinone/menaquinone biosynthesis C-methylase UbiE
MPRSRSNGWASNVSAAVMSGQDLKFGDSTFDASVANFGIFFFPNLMANANEIRRTLKEGGMAVVTLLEVFAATFLSFPFLQLCSFRSLCIGVPWQRPVKPNAAVRTLYPPQFAPVPRLFPILAPQSRLL